MPKCVTCRENHTSNSIGNLFIDAQIKCNICLETLPSNETWVLPCGHSNCKNCLRSLGFTEKNNEVNFDDDINENELFYNRNSSRTVNNLIQINPFKKYINTIQM